MGPLDSGVLYPVPMPLTQQEHDVIGLVDNRRKQTRDVAPEHGHVERPGFGRGQKKQSPSLRWLWCLALKCCQWFVVQHHNLVGV